MVRAAVTWQLSILAALLILAGCNEWGTLESEQAPRWRVAHAQGFRDIPVPESFSLIEERSTSSVTRQQRFCNVTYRGRGAQITTLRFLKDHFAIVDWRLVEEVQDFGSTLLIFKKGSELALVWAEQQGPNVEVQIIVVGMND